MTLDAPEGDPWGCFACAPPRIAPLHSFGVEERGWGSLATPGWTASLRDAIQPPRVPLWGIQGALWAPRASGHRGGRGPYPAPKASPPHGLIFILISSRAKTNTGNSAKLSQFLAFQTRVEAEKSHVQGCRGLYSRPPMRPLMAQLRC